MNDTELSEQAVLNRAFDVNLLTTTVVGGTSTDTSNETEFTVQKILNRVFENNTLRVIHV